VTQSSANEGNLSKSDKAIEIALNTENSNSTFELLDTFLIDIAT
jgi:hypothetical protein